MSSASNPCLGHLPSADDRQPSDLSAALVAHAVFDLLPTPARDLILREGVCRSSYDAAAPAQGALTLVLNGALGLFPKDAGTCVGLYGAGGAHGWEFGLGATLDTRIEPVLTSRWVEVPATRLTAVMGTTWMEHVFARHALGRLRLVQAEASCNALHPINRRLAKWLLRLSAAAGSHTLACTQTMMADILGVQRTSVNAAAATLQRSGAIRCIRGRWLILNRQLLAAAACGCGDPPEGAAAVGAGQSTVRFDQPWRAAHL